MFAQIRRVEPVLATLLAALLILLCALAVRPLDRELRLRLEGGTRALQEAFESKTGFRLTYEALSPSVLGGLSVRRLIVSDGIGRVIVEARKVSFHYNLFALFQKKGEPFITEIGVDGAEASITNEDLRKLKGLFAAGPGGASSGKLTLPRLRLLGRDLHLEFPDLIPGGAMLKARRITLDAGIAEPSLDLAGNLSLSLPETGQIDVDLGVNGQVSAVLDAARLRVNVAARGRDFELLKQDFDLSLSNGFFEVRKARDSAPVDLYGRYEIDPGVASVLLHCENFRMDSLFRASGKLSFLEPWFKQGWSGTLSLRLPKFDFSRLSYDVDLAGILPETVRPGAWKIRVSAFGSIDEIEVRESEAEGPEGYFSYTGALRNRDLAVHGYLVARASLLDGRLPIDARIRAEGASGSYGISCDSFFLGGVRFGKLDAKAKLVKDSVGFTLALGLPVENMIANSRLGIPSPSFLEAEGSYNSGEQPLLECSLSWGLLDGSAFAPLLDEFLDAEAARILKSAILSGSVLLRSDFSHLSWSTSDLSLRSRLVPDVQAVVSASGSDLTLKIRKAALAWKNWKADLAGNVELTKTGAIDFDASILFSGIPYAFEGSYRDRNLRLKGDYGLAFNGRLIDGVVLASLSLASLPVPLPGFPVIVSIDADARFATEKDWTLALASFAIQPMSSASDGLRLPTIRLAGLFGPDGGQVKKASLSDSISSVEGSGQLVWGAKSRSPTVKISMVSPSGEAYRIDAGFSNNRLDTTISIRSSPLQRFVKERLSGLFDGNLLISGPLDGLEFTYNAKLNQGRFDGSPIALDFAGSNAGGSFSVSEGHCQWRGFELSTLKGKIDMTRGLGSISGRFDSHVTLPGSGFNFSATATSRAVHPASIEAFLGDCRFEGSLANYVYKDFRSALWPLVVDLSSRGLSIQGGPRNEVLVNVLSDGSFAAKAVSPFPFQLDLRGSTRGDQIAVDATGLSLDLPILIALIGPLPVDFQGGRLSGNLVIKGPSADPEFSGALRIDDCKLSMPGWIKETAGPVSAPVVVDGKRLFLQAPSIPILSSHFALTLEMILDGWIPTDIHVAMRSLPGTSVPLETRILGVVISGFAVPNLDLQINGPILSVKGSLLLQKTDVVISPETLAPGVEATEAPSSLLDIRLGINFGKGVRLLFPDKDYPVIAGNADPASHLDVLYDQSREDLSVKGDVLLRGGDAFYIQRNFFLKSAKLHFNENSQKAFDPLVTMLAELRDSTASGPIIVTLRADNARISNFKPRLLSNPSMSESDIALLLGQGLLALKDSGDLDLRRVAIAGSEFVPQLNVTKAFESRIREALNLDVFYVHSLALQRWLFDVTGAGNENAATLSDYLKETSLYAGKYLSDKVFLHALARLRTDPLVPSGSLGLESELGLEFETPFGILQWNFSPQHPENLFVNDQSLSLTWRLAF